MHDFGAGGGQTSLRELREYDLEKRMRAIELQQATLMHLPDDVRKLADAVQALASKVQPAAQNDQTLLAIQRTLDVLSKQQTTPASELIRLLQTPPPGAGWKTGLGYGALLAVIAIMAWKMFVGG